MDTFSLIGFAVVTAILSCTVRQFNNAAGMNVALAGGAFILLSIIAKVSGVAAALSSVAASGGLEVESVAVIVKEQTCSERRSLTNHQLILELLLILGSALTEMTCMARASE